MADAATSMSFDYENFVQDLSNCLQLPEFQNPIVPHQPAPPEKPQFAAANAAVVLVNELACAANMDDATLRATKLLEELERFIRTGSVEEARQEFIKEREENEGLRRVNVLLKRAVVIQHERQIKLEGCSRELQDMKRLVKEYEEQVKRLEVDKYSLAIRLKLAQNATSIPRTLHPDIF